MDQVERARWVDRLGRGSRIGLLIAALLIALLFTGFVAGFFVGAYEHGHILPRKPLGWVALGLMLLIAWGLFRLIRTLFGSLAIASWSGFDRRYSRMWVLIVALSFPFGIALSVLTPSNQEHRSFLRLIDGPLAPEAALALAVALTILLGIAALLYHRAIDDHEERAFLWGSQIGYYFLAFALPVYWLLERGTLLPSLTIEIAMALLLASFVVQAVVWAWFKFR